MDYMEYIPDIVTVKDEKIQSNVDSFFSDIISNLEKEAVISTFFTLPHKKYLHSFLAGLAYQLLTDALRFTNVTLPTLIAR